MKHIPEARLARADHRPGHLLAPLRHKRVRDASRLIGFVERFGRLRGRLDQRSARLAIMRFAYSEPKLSRASGVSHCSAVWGGHLTMARIAGSLPQTGQTQRGSWEPKGCSTVCKPLQPPGQTG
jgi:hypothetical protein